MTKVESSKLHFSEDENMSFDGLTRKLKAKVKNILKLLVIKNLKNIEEPFH